MIKLNNYLEALEKNGVDAIVISNPSDIYYLTAFTGTTAYVVIAKDKVTFITDGRYEAQSKDQVRGSEVLDISIVTNYDKGILDKLAGVSTVYLTKNAPMSLYSTLKEAGLDVRVEDKNLLGINRSKKSGLEVSRLKNQYTLAGEAFFSFLNEINYGEAESVWAAKLEYQMKIRGSIKPSFDTIVASGVRSSLPHGVASNKVVNKGEPVTVDYGSNSVYNSDQTRLIYDGDDKEYLKIVDIVRDAMLLAQNSVKQGITTKELDAVARGYIEKHGYGEYFVHGLGHGVGIDIHELPFVSYRTDTVLEDGMVITIEPGIYIPNKYGVRIENTVVVRKSGFELLTHEKLDYLYKIN